MNFHSTAAVAEQVGTTLGASERGCVHDLLEMLTTCRPAGGKSERRFIKKYLMPLKPLVDECGNLIVEIGNSSIMYSCHTDTVHHRGGEQLVHYEKGYLGLARENKHKTNCLGADDTTGVWLMREMIKAKVPGLYVFHRAEEIGGLGSRHLVNTNPGLVQGIRACIALDRRDTTDIITHQSGGRCCSDVFARSLASQLGRSFAPSSNGIFTDSANYTDLIGECTNVSVGYHDEHSADEKLDLYHVLDLRDALLTLDPKQLEFKRNPGEFDPDDWTDWRYSHTWSMDRDLFTPRLKVKGGTTQYGSSHMTVADLVKDYPDEVADYLEEWGYDAETIWEEIEKRLGNYGSGGGGKFRGA